MALKKSQRSLKKWGAQNGVPLMANPVKAKRYLPDKAWKSLTKAEKASTNRAKAKGNKAGKQFVKQPKKIAKKVRRFRK